MRKLAQKAQPAGRGTLGTVKPLGGPEESQEGVVTHIAPFASNTARLDL